MPTQQYDAIWALHPKLTQEEQESIQKKFQNKLAECGGTLLKTNVWGLRPLAFRPQRFKDAVKGFFIHMELSGDGKVPEELKNITRVTEGIVRFIITRALPPSPPRPIRVAPSVTTTETPANG